MNRIRLAARTALATLLVALASFACAGPASAFTLGMNNDDLMRYAGWSGYGSDPVPNDAALAAGLANGAKAGAKQWRFMVLWRRVARTTAAPTGAQAADPAWAGYKWDDVDRIVRAVTAAGMEPIPWIARAPDWAEGANRPPVSKLVPEGTWKPNAALLEPFAQAFAKRYSGSYPDPARPGQNLPRVKTFQAWNEPNLWSEITPQWTKQGGRDVLSSPTQYRRILNAFYRGVKRSQPSATVLTAATGPFGDFNPGDPRTQPLRFWRDFLCASDGRTVKIRKSCPKVSFDGWAHHTYPIGPPSRHARNADDVTVPDMGKLTRLFDAFAKAKKISRAASKNVWMTEMSWDSYPDPNGVSLDLQAQYLQGAFFQLWKAGVQHVLWWNLRDDAKGADWNASLQSGLYLRGTDPSQDQPKPSFTAYRFPFTAYRKNGVALLWSKPPAAGPVAIQALTGGQWKTVATLRLRSDSTVYGSLRVGPGTDLRAVQGADTSLTWRTS